MRGRGTTGGSLRAIPTTSSRAARPAHSCVAIALVTHGGVLGVAYRHAKGIPLEMPRTFTVPNAAVNRLRVERRRWVIEAWADTGHLAAAPLDDE